MDNLGNLMALKYMQPTSAGELLTEGPLHHWKDKHLLCCPWSDSSEVHFKIFQEFLVNWSIKLWKQ